MNYVFIFFKKKLLLLDVEGLALLLVFNGPTVVEVLQSLLQRTMRPPVGAAARCGEGVGQR